MIPAAYLQDELGKVFHDVGWDYTALLHADGRTSPIPKESRVVAAILEGLAIKQIKRWAEEHQIVIEWPSNEREYPDMTLRHESIGGIIALDIKTARIKSRQHVNKLTLGSYGGYFRNPDKQTAGCRIPYAHFNKHWVVAFLYCWDPKKPPEQMVKVRHVIIAEKWSIASKSAGTGTTRHIGSITDIRRLQNHEGDFSSEKEFETYWRKYKI